MSGQDSGNSQDMSELSQKGKSEWQRFLDQVRICQSLVRKEKVSGQDSGISQDM